MKNTASISPVTESLLSSLDIDDFQDLETATFTLLHPLTGAPTSSTVTLASKEHPSRRKIDLAKTRRFRQQFVKNGKMPTTDPLEDVEEETDYLVASTLGWNITQGGKPLEFSTQAARDLYTNPTKQWLRNQVLEAINKNELFIQSSAKA